MLPHLLCLNPEKLRPIPLVSFHLEHYSIVPRLNKKVFLLIIEHNEAPLLQLYLTLFLLS